VHALHTVHAVPDLRVVAGRLRDGVFICQSLHSRFAQSMNSLRLASLTAQARGVFHCLPTLTGFHQCGIRQQPLSRMGRIL
jgi:hypothetical protein